MPTGKNVEWKNVEKHLESAHVHVHVHVHVPVRVHGDGHGQRHGHGRGHRQISAVKYSRFYSSL